MFNSFKKQGPEFRVVGGAPEKTKERIKKEFSGLFGEEHLSDLTKEQRELLDRVEYPKSKEELALIDFANEETNKLMESVGAEPFDVSEKNIHILPAEEFEKMAGNKSNSAIVTYRHQGIVLNAAEVRRESILFGESTFHELIHLKSHVTLEVEEKTGEGGIKETTRTFFRAGLGMVSAQKHWYSGKSHEHFKGLNEAIVATQESRFIKKMLDLPFMKKQKERMNSDEVREKKEMFFKKTGISGEEIGWVYEDGSFWTTGYEGQQNVLRFVISEIVKEFPDKYKNSEDAEKEFLRGLFTGKILTIARLIEATFGKGSFEVLGMMGIDKETPVNTFEYLKRARVRNTENKEK